MWHRIFIDNDLIEKLFVYIRNVFYCALILAVGLYTHVHPPEFFPNTLLDPYFGYPLIVFGLFMFLLNLVDASNQILKLKYNSLVKALLIFIYVFVTGWLAIVVCFFRMK